MKYKIVSLCVKICIICVNNCFKFEFFAENVDIKYRNILLLYNRDTILNYKNIIYNYEKRQ